MLDEAIELLTKQMLKEAFENKDGNKETILVMSKVELYKFCIKLVKLIKRINEMEKIK